MVSISNAQRSKLGAMIDGLIVTRLGELRAAGWKVIHGHGANGRTYGYVQSPTSVKRDITARSEQAFLAKAIKAADALRAK